MDEVLIQKFEKLIRTSNKKLYYEYLRILNLFHYFIKSSPEFVDRDRFEILSFFYETILTKNENFYSILDSSEKFIFKGDRFKEKNFRLALEFFRNRSVFKLNNDEAISLIEEHNHYTAPVIEFLRVNSRAIDEIFYLNDQLLKDSLQILSNQRDFFKIYSDEYCDILTIQKNFFEEVRPSFFSREGLFIRFCQVGQIGFQKDSLFLNENETLISKGFPLGRYKVLTEKVNYITIYIKSEFLKNFNIEFPSYLLKKTSWQLDESSLEIINRIDEFQNPKIILLKFLSEIILKLTDEEPLLNIKIIKSETLQKIIKYIHNNLEEYLSISFLQKEFGVNKNTLNSYFKDHFGVSPSKYIINKKLEKASTLLLETDFSVTDIAFQLNFSSTSKFSTYFKGKFALTPLQFKKRYDDLID